MLYIKTKIGKSRIHWLWLLADQNIKKDMIIGEFIFWLDICISNGEYQKLDKNFKTFFKDYGRRDKHTKKYMINIDNTRFINHSETPNIKHKHYILLAAKDMEKWEELFDDYNDIDDWFATKEIK